MAYVIKEAKKNKKKQTYIYKGELSGSWELPGVVVVDKVLPSSKHTVSKHTRQMTKESPEDFSSSFEPAQSSQQSLLQALQVEIYSQYSWQPAIQRFAPVEMKQSAQLLIIILSIL